MTFAELLESDGWKNFMAKLYGLGAAVVIVGALFKIMHWPGAGFMLTVGLSVEAVIFIFSAFEPMHADDDWSLVYPELAGLGDEREMEPEDKPKQLTKKKDIDTGESAIEKFDKLLKEGELHPDLFKKMGTGLQKLTQTADNLSNISGAAVATNKYTEKVKSATNSMGEFAKSADVISQSSNEFAKIYQETAKSMNNQFESVSRSNKSYGGELNKLNKNLSALNAVYELQLQSTNERIKKSQTIYSDLDSLAVDLHSTVRNSQKYKEEVSKLGKKLTALNTVYGNMLNAMNVKV